MQVEALTHCRNCGSTELKTVLDLGEIYPSDFVENQDNLVKAPLALVKCNSCYLVQLKHTVELDSMYKTKYWYLSSLNSSMLRDLKDIILGLENYINLIDGDTIIDTGCNDGSLFTFYTNSNLVKIGFDPAPCIITDRAKNHCTHFINDYFPSNLIPISDNSVKAITSIAMLYDLPDPNSFVSEIKRILTEDGVWISQFTDLLSMFRLNEITHVCHEHLEYYTLNIIYNIFKNNGLSIFRVEYNSVNGGSVRIYADKGYREVESNVQKYLKEETDYFNSYNGSFENFEFRLNNIKIELLSLLTSLKQEGKTIYGLGASTKGNTLLQWLGVDSSLLNSIGEVHKDKFGLKTIGTNIPIVSEQDILDTHPEYIFLIIWQFEENIIKKLFWYLSNGTKIISPLPVPHIITNKEVCLL